jgi:hypothetical protein
VPDILSRSSERGEQVISLCGDVPWLGVFFFGCAWRGRTFGADGHDISSLGSHVSIWSIRSAARGEWLISFLAPGLLPEATFSFFRIVFFFFFFPFPTQLQPN